VSSYEVRPPTVGTTAYEYLQRRHNPRNLTEDDDLLMDSCASLHPLGRATLRSLRISQSETAGTIECFISDPQNLELAYALLGLWKMENRAAHMRDFGSFVESIQQAHVELIALESALTQGDTAKIMRYLGAAYDHVHVMTGKSKLISNAKLFHFFLPEHLMPVDSDNTLGFLYGQDGKENRYESKERYLEIIQFSSPVRSAIVERQIAWEKCMDDLWNANLPKILDNAIFFQKDNLNKANFNSRLQGMYS
jgi:hypothetical protein